MTPADHADVLALNQVNVALLAPLDHERLIQVERWAERAQVIEHRGRFAGFVITMGPDTAYDSDNYRWFSDRYPQFCYLDRIALAEDVRRIGLGSRVYDEIEQEAPGRVLLEVNVDPPNVASLEFHRRRGYVEVGRQGPPGHVVAMLVRELA